MVVNLYNHKTWENIKNYDEEVISIFKDEKQNLIIEEIKKIKNKDKKEIADFGCGVGKSFKFIKKFKKITAIDFSENMLKQAKETSKTMKINNINFINSKLQDVELKNKVDVIIAANSIFPSNYNEFDLILKNLKNNIKKKGEIILVLLSFESLTFFYQILAHNEFKINGQINDSLKLINKYIEDSKYSPFGYIITTLGMQKHWIKEEIKFRLENFKFKKVEIEKLELNWINQIKQPKLKNYPKLWFWMIKIKV